MLSLKLARIDKGAVSPDLEVFALLMSMVRHESKSISMLKKIAEWQYSKRPPSHGREIRKWLR